MWAALCASAALVFVSSWILVPIPEAFLLPFGVGAPELSPALFCVSVVIAVCTALHARRFGTARLALVLLGRLIPEFEHNAEGVLPMANRT